MSGDDEIIIRGRKIKAFAEGVKAAAVAPVYGPVKRWHIAVFAVFAVVVVLILV